MPTLFNTVSIILLLLYLLSGIGKALSLYKIPVTSVAPALHMEKVCLEDKNVNAILFFTLSVVSHLHFFYPTHSFEI